MLTKFSEALQPLLYSELVAGNAVLNFMEDWPSRGRVTVMLAKPFKSFRDVRRLGLLYKQLQLGNKLKACYMDPATGHLLACKD